MTDPRYRLFVVAPGYLVDGIKMEYGSILAGTGKLGQHIPVYVCPHEGEVWKDAMERADRQFLEHHQKGDLHEVQSRKGRSATFFVADERARFDGSPVTEFRWRADVEAETPITVGAEHPTDGELEYILARLSGIEGEIFQDRGLDPVSDVQWMATTLRHLVQYVIQDRKETNEFYGTTDQDED